MPIVSHSCCVSPLPTCRRYPLREICTLCRKFAWKNNGLHEKKKFRKKTLSRRKTGINCPRPRHSSAERADERLAAALCSDVLARVVEPDLTLDARMVEAGEGAGVEEKGELACEGLRPARADDTSRVVVGLEPHDSLYTDGALDDRADLRRRCREAARDTGGEM